MHLYPCAINMADMANAPNSGLSGPAGARKVLRHTILSNPKATAWLMAALVLAVAVLAVLYMRARKSAKDSFQARSAGIHQVSNSMTGGNQAMWSHGEQTGPLSVPDGNFTSKTVQDSGRDPSSAADLVGSGLFGSDTGTVANMTAILDSGASTSAMDQKIGSLCSSASSRAQAELAGHAAANGGLSGGAPTPQ
jgi:hypothetical protein